MAWEYEGPSASTKDEVRFLIGDTDFEDQLLSDEEIQFLVGNLVQGSNPALIFTRELFEPDIRILGNQHKPRHPVLIWTVTLVLLIFATTERLQRDIRRPTVALLADDLFAQEIHAAPDADGKMLIQQMTPSLQDELQLALQRIG